MFSASSLGSVVDAMQKVMRSAEALLGLTADMAPPEERDRLLAVARRLIALGSDMRSGLTEPQRLTPAFTEVLELAGQVANICGNIAEPGLRARVLTEAANLGEAAKEFLTSLRSAAESRGIRV